MRAGKLRFGEVKGFSQGHLAGDRHQTFAAPWGNTESQFCIPIPHLQPPPVSYAGAAPNLILWGLYQLVLPLGVAGASRVLCVYLAA